MPLDLTTEQAAILVAIITAVVGPAIGGWIGWQRARKSAEATAHREVSQGWRERAEGEASVSTVILAWSKRLEGQVEVLEERVKRLRTERNTARARNMQLESYARTLMDTLEAGDCGPAPPMPYVEEDD